MNSKHHITKQQKKSEAARRKILLSLAGVHIAPVISFGDKQFPKGLMLNLDFEGVKDGLIPSKALYPLFVPLGDLFVDRIKHRNLLIVDPERGLNIPHSSLLDPSGDEWIISVRVFLVTDGLILSQGNDKHGFAIYTQENQVFARVRSGNTAFTLQEDPQYGISKFRKKWVTIELRIRKNYALLSLNRKRAALMQNQPALTGDSMRIRLGTHRETPGVFQDFQGMETTGFTGAVSSLKIHRQ